MAEPNTLKMLILAESARITELLNTIPESELNYRYSYDYAKDKAELKAKMAELRRDTIAMEKRLYAWKVSE